ncbi:hypothetical protein STENM327S_04527 [Streptomyces tendae]
MGWLPALAQVVGRTRPAPVVNALTHAPLLSKAAVLVAGVADREVPLFAERTFEQWFAEHEPEGDGRRGSFGLRSPSGPVGGGRAAIRRPLCQPVSPLARQPLAPVPAADGRTVTGAVTRLPGISRTGAVVGTTCTRTVARATLVPGTGTGTGVLAPERGADRLQGGGDRLEEGLAADRAVTAAAGGQADREGRPG